MTKTIDHPYTMSGLDNVILKSLPVITDDACEECIFIPNVNGLHRALLRAIVTKPVAMTPKELRFVRSELGLTQAQLGAIIDLDGQTIGRWERGEHPIDNNAETIVRSMALDYIGPDGSRPAVSELAGWTKVPAQEKRIVIDASDPSDYRAVA